MAAMKSSAGGLIEFDNSSRGFQLTVGHFVKPSRRGATIERSRHYPPPKGCVSSSPHIPSSLRDERFSRHPRLGWPTLVVVVSKVSLSAHSDFGGFSCRVTPIASSWLRRTKKIGTFMKNRGRNSIEQRTDVS
jgi:hypothetical protein